MATEPGPNKNRNADKEMLNNENNGAVDIEFVNFLMVESQVAQQVR